MADSKLNDPNARVGRGEAMQMMKERRREKVAEDMEPADHAALVSGAAPAAPTAPDAGDEARAADERPQEKSVYAIAAELEAAEPATNQPAGETKPAAGETKPAAGETKPAAGETLDLTAKVKLKINGQEVEKTLAEVIADAQKVSAADDYLQRSRDQLHSVNELADQVRAKLAKSDSPPAAAAAADTTQADPAEEGVAALFRGDEETAKAAFRKLAQAPSFDPAALADLVQHRMTLGEARAAFLSAHPDADSDPIAIGVANTCLKLELAKAGVAAAELLPPGQIKPVFEAAAKAMSAWRGGHTSPATTPAVNRAGKKAAIDELPAASARASTQESPPKTNSSVIASMRAARPGAVPSVH